VVLIWGPSALLGRRAPGFRARSISWPEYFQPITVFLMCSARSCSLLLLMFQRTRWACWKSAAHAGPGLGGALGVNQSGFHQRVRARVFLSPRARGALQIPRDAVHHALDLAHHRRRVSVVVIVRAWQHQRRFCHGGL